MVWFVNIPVRVVSKDAVDAVSERLSTESWELQFAPSSHVSPTSLAPLRKSVWPSPSKGNAVKKSARQ